MVVMPHEEEFTANHSLVTTKQKNKQKNLELNIVHLSLFCIFVKAMNLSRWIVMEGIISAKDTVTGRHYYNYVRHYHYQLLSML